MNEISLKICEAPYNIRPWMNDLEAANSASRKSLKSAIAGAFTGMTETCISYPTEYVKTQLQLDGKGSMQKYHGSVDCIKKTIRQKGLFGLYKGFSILFIGSIPRTTMRFGGFEFCKDILEKSYGKQTSQILFLSGVMAGVTEAVFAVTPMETLRVKIISDQRNSNPKFKGLIDGIRQIIAREGVVGMYKGLTPTILKQASSQGIRFTIIETGKQWYPRKPVPKLAIGAFGAMAAVVSVIVNTPFDVMKTRMQGLDGFKYKNTVDCFFKTFKKEGPSAFYKGTIPRILKSSAEVSTAYILFDICLDILNYYWVD